MEGESTEIQHKVFIGISHLQLSHHVFPPCPHIFACICNDILINIKTSSNTFQTAGNFLQILYPKLSYLASVLVSR